MTELMWLLRKIAICLYGEDGTVTVVLRLTPGGFVVSVCIPGENYCGKGFQSPEEALGEAVKSEAFKLHTKLENLSKQTEYMRGLLDHAKHYKIPGV